jgi:cytoskeleton protein RodZ
VAPSAPVAAPQQQPPAPAAVPPVAGAPAGIVLRARAETWVQVRDTRANQTVFDRVMRGGDTFQVPAGREGLVLTTGKAENLDVLLDGQPMAVIAGAVGVRRGISLDAERVRGAGPVQVPAQAAAAGRPSAEAAPRAAAPQAQRP